ncbi:Uncharacterized protein FWK35_00018811 [Aphis craccivora]|uniref:Uncharacterized protein n=1 Tax=Aphis craccivora TaxID=307492 RepID=A0A6G0Y093_APHCR|nr:Uncharacterized protein FWK35_00018811 [Aphis craccivora]
MCGTNKVQNNRIKEQVTTHSKKKIVEYLRREEGEAAYTTRIWYMYNDWSQNQYLLSVVAVIKHDNQTKNSPENLVSLTAVDDSKSADVPNLKGDWHNLFNNKDAVGIISGCVIYTKDEETKILAIMSSINITYRFVILISLIRYSLIKSIYIWNGILVKLEQWFKIVLESLSVRKLLSIS